MRLITTLAKPFWRQHKKQAQEVRGSQAVQAWYCQAAQGAHLDTLSKAVALLWDVPSLEFVGFDCRPDAAFQEKLTANSHLVEEQDQRAKHYWGLLLALLHRRAASMAWHTDFYPGRLALLLSPEEEGHQAFEAELKVDLLAHPRAEQLAPSDSFLASLVRQSWFRTVLGRELAELYSTSSPATARAAATKLARDLYSGFGHSKVVEDTFSHLRDRELRDGRNSVVELRRLYTLAAAAPSLPGQGWTPVAAQGGPPEPKLSTSAFQPALHTPGFDRETFTGPLQWPSYTPLSPQSLYAQRQLLRHCYLLDLLPTASQAWRNCLLPTGTLFRRVATEDWCFSLGPVGAAALLTWAAKPLQVGTLTGWTLELSAELQELNWAICLDWSDFEVLPTQPASPAHLFAECRGRPPTGPAVLALQLGPSQPLLEYACRQCFWQLPASTLQRIMRAEGLPVPRGLSLLDTLRALLKHVLPSLGVQEQLDILDQRSSLGRGLEAEDLPAEVLEEVFGEAEGAGLPDCLHNVNREPDGEYMEAVYAPPQPPSPWFPRAPLSLCPLVPTVF